MKKKEIKKFIKEVQDELDSIIEDSKKIVYYKTDLSLGFDVLDQMNTQRVK